MKLPNGERADLGTKIEDYVLSLSPTQSPRLRIRARYHSANREVLQRSPSRSGQRRFHRAESRLSWVVSVRVDAAKEFLNREHEPRARVSAVFLTLLSFCAIFQAPGQVAQSVEQRTENPRVGGSIPSLATFNFRYLHVPHRFHFFVGAGCYKTSTVNLC